MEYLELNYYFQEIFVNEMLIQNQNQILNQIHLLMKLLKKKKIQLFLFFFVFNNYLLMYSTIAM